ncbi:MAG: hypothetical protein JWN15_825 [Firmicutes bacterium]|nr:hypothetical protein [Bacillota bacterium]
MLERIKAMEAAGQWAEIRRTAADLVEGLMGDDLSRAYLATSKAFEQTAICPDDYRAALAHAKRAAAAAAPGGLLHTWALHRVASYLADFGDYRGAERAATAFLDALPRHPQAETAAPWVYFHLGVVRSHQGHHDQAVALLRKAIAANAGEISERAQLHLAWTLAESGRVLEAFEALPSSLVHVSQGHLNAACAVVFAAAGDWQGARIHAMAALRARTAGEWRIFDTVEAAEMATVLQRAATYAGNSALAASWHNHSAAILAGWVDGTFSALLPSLPQGGGAFLEEAASHSGPAGAKRCGLRGAVG